MSYRDLPSVSDSIKNQPIVAEKRIPQASETCDEGGFAKPGSAQKCDRIAVNDDRARMKHDTPSPAERKRQDLVEKEVLHGSRGHFRHRPSRRFEAVARNLEIGQTGEAHQDHAFWFVVETSPDDTRIQIPLVKRWILYLFLHPRRPDAEKDAMFVDRSASFQIFRPGNGSLVGT